MTGPAEGKIILKGAKVYLHIKGKAGARITHIDIEHPIINKIIKPKEATYCAGKVGGCFIGLRTQMLKRAEKIIKQLKSKSVR